MLIGRMADVDEEKLFNFLWDTDEEVSTKEIKLVS